MYIYRANDASLAIGQLFRKRSLATIYSVIKLLPCKKTFQSITNVPFGKIYPSESFSCLT